MGKVARLKWSEENERYEIYVNGQLKSYSTTEAKENTPDTHEEGRKLLCKKAHDRGYTVIGEGE